MQSGPTDDVGQKGISVHFSPLMHYEASYNEPVFLYSSDHLLLLAAEKGAEDDVVCSPDLLLWARDVDALESESWGLFAWKSMGGHLD